MGECGGAGGIHGSPLEKGGADAAHPHAEASAHVIKRARRGRALGRIRPGESIAEEPGEGLVDQVQVGTDVGRGFEERLPWVEGSRPVFNGVGGREPRGRRARSHALSRSDPGERDAVNGEARGCGEASAPSGVEGGDGIGDGEDGGLGEGPEFRAAEVVEGDGKTRFERADEQAELRTDELGLQARGPAEIGGDPVESGWGDAMGGEIGQGRGGARQQRVERASAGSFLDADWNWGGPGDDKESGGVGRGGEAEPGGDGRVVEAGGVGRGGPRLKAQRNQGRGERVGGESRDGSLRARETTCDGCGIDPTGGGATDEATLTRGDRAAVLEERGLGVGVVAEKKLSDGFVGAFEAEGDATGGVGAREADACVPCGEAEGPCNNAVIEAGEARGAIDLVPAADLESFDDPGGEREPGASIGPEDAAGHQPALAVAVDGLAADAPPEGKGVGIDHRGGIEARVPGQALDERPEIGEEVRARNGTGDGPSPSGEAEEQPFDGVVDGGVDLVGDEFGGAKDGEEARGRVVLQTLGQAFDVRGPDSREGRQRERSGIKDVVVPDAAGCKGAAGEAGVGIGVVVDPVGPDAVEERG